jgi:tetratricopeptide (TPR) repeat protein
MYAIHHQELLDYPSFKGASDYGKAVYSTWDLSFQAISARAIPGNKGQDARGARSAIMLLQTFAFFHHDNIAEEILERAALSQDYGCDMNVLSSIDIINQLLQVDKDGRWDPSFFRGGMQTLLSFSLARRGVNASVYSVHPLVHKWSRDRMILSDKQAQFEYARALISCSITWEFSGVDYAFCQTLIPHIKANNQYALEAGISIIFNDAEYDALALALDENGYWNEAEELRSVVLKSRRRIHGAEHPGTLKSMSNLASTYSNQGKWKEAEDLGATELETSKRVFGTDHPSTLTSMNNLAITYSNQGKWKEAEKLDSVVLETRKRVIGADHADTLMSMSNLACTYNNQGKWKEAEELGAMVLETRKHE